MDFHRRDAGRGIAWLTEAVEILLRNPTPFLLMGLVIAMLASLPVVGALVLSIFGPALNGGVIHAVRTQTAGGKADFMHLFQAFNQPGKLPHMLMLCLPGIAGGLLIGMLAVAFLGSALLAAGVSHVADADAFRTVSLGSGGALFALLAIAVGLVAFALVFFATPRVMLRGVAPVDAMKQSLRAAWGNVLPILVYVFGILFASMLVTMILGTLSVQLAQIVVVTIAFPLAATVMEVATRDVFGDEAPASAEGEPPAPPTLEA